MGVESPCIGLCIFDEKTKLCFGCVRTPDEIRRWEKLTELRAEKLSIILAAGRPNREANRNIISRS